MKKKNLKLAFALFAIILVPFVAFLGGCKKEDNQNNNNSNNNNSSNSNSNSQTATMSSEEKMTRDLFERTSVNEQSVPSLKLVFVGNSVKNMNFSYVEDFENIENLPENFENLNTMQKYVFSSQGFYDLVRNQLFSSNINERAKLEALNSCAEYIFSLRTIKNLYAEYDVLLINETERADDITTWNDDLYKINLGSQEFPNYVSYKTLLFQIVNTFYSYDLDGKTIGIIPLTLNSEIFFYLDYDFAIGGVSNDYFKDLDEDVLIEFVLSGNNQTIQADDNLGKRILDGTLKFTKGEDNNYTPLMLNRGNVYKSLSEFYRETDVELSNYFKSLFKNWLCSYSKQITEENVNSYTVDRQGNVVEN